MSSGARGSIPSGLRKMIQNIKDITGNHSDEEIYSMLKECSMDPNETTHKLLLQDPFHEVKRKRDKKRESLNKESHDPRWKPGMQGRGNKGGRGNYSPRYTDAGAGRGSSLGKEDTKDPGPEKAASSSLLPVSYGTKNKESASVTSPSTLIMKGPATVASGSSTTVVRDAKLSTGSWSNQVEEDGAADISKGKGPPALPPPVDASKKNPTIDGANSASEPLSVSSQNSLIPSAVGATKHEVENQFNPVEQISAIPGEIKSTTGAEVGSFMQGKMPSKSQEIRKNKLSDSLQSVSSTHISSAVSTPSSNLNNRTQVIPPQKVGPTKKWKPKPANPSSSQGSAKTVSSEVPTVTIEANTQSRPTFSAVDSKEATLELQRKLEETHISDGRLVTLPTHLHRPEVEKFDFCFGSFDTSFALNSSYGNGPETDKSPLPLTETSDGIEETTEERSSSNQNALPTSDEGDYPDHTQTSSHVIPENLSAEDDVSPSVDPEYNESKQETALPTGGHQFSVAHTSPNYSLGFMPPIPGSHLTPFESSEAQGRDVPRIPSYVVQQPFDPANYYAQFYRSGADTDGRVSPFHSAGFPTKYNGNVVVMSPQTSQSPQEGGNSMVLPTASPPPLVTQAAGLMQSSIAVPQQHLPIYRQPTGVHFPHYPPSYIPYGPYFSPFYVQPPAIHQFLGSGAFPQQQPQAGGLYPAPPTAKYSLPQFKPGSNAGNPNNIGLPGYLPYGASPAGYNPGSPPNAGNSTNEDVAANQFKESSVYVTGPQSEGSGVWITTPGRDVSGLQATSFYNLPQGHGAYAGIYHPAQPVQAPTVHPLLQQSQTMPGPADVAGPTGTVYQQQQQPQQHSQMNWQPTSY